MNETTTSSDANSDESLDDEQVAFDHDWEDDDDRERPNTRYVAFADILGFRNLVRSNSHTELTRIYREALHAAALSGYFARGSQEALKAYTNKKPDTLTATVNMQVISDSIVMWTFSDSDADFILISSALRFLLHAAFVNGLPLRSALAWGHAEYLVAPRIGLVDLGGFSFSSLVGDALIEAYEAEKNQEWSGGIVLKSVVNRVGQPWFQQYAERTQYFKFWLIPTKKDTVHAYAVNWPQAGNRRLTSEEIRTAFANHGKRSDSAAVRRKIEHTMAFVKRVGWLDE